jgi:hypothetical protein
MLKDLKKKYEKASLEYSQILAKIESLQSHKKLDIVKLYSAEKERVRLKKIFDEATEALQTHCDDVQDRLGFDFLEWMISFMRAQKTMFGFVYGELQEIKEYLDELHAWCKEEAFIFQEHKKERDQLQAQALETEHLEHIKQFLKVTNTSTLNQSIISSLSVSITLCLFIFCDFVICLFCLFFLGEGTDEKIFFCDLLS